MTNRRCVVERSTSSRIANSLYVGISTSTLRTVALKVLLSAAARRHRWSLLGRSLGLPSLTG
jgi:hypothetical protein